jgi:hypothetical protein
VKFEKGLQLLQHVLGIFIMTSRKHSVLSAERKKNIVRAAFGIKDFDQRKQYLINESPADFDINEPLTKLRDWANKIYGGRCCYSHQVDYAVACHIRFIVSTQRPVDIEILRAVLYLSCVEFGKLQEYNNHPLDEAWAVAFSSRHDLPILTSYGPSSLSPPPPTVPNQYSSPR